MSNKQGIPLSNGLIGQEFQIETITLKGFMRRRLMDLGFIPGATVRVLQKSPLGDPIAFRVNGTTIALREEESSQIFGELIGGESGNV